MLKDRVGEGNQLANAIREVASGGSVLDPTIVEALASPLRSDGELTADEEELLQQIAAGTPINAIAVARHTTPADVDAAIEKLFVTLGEGLSAGQEGSLERLKRLHRAIMDRKEQGDSLGRLLPGGVAEKLRGEGRGIGETEELEVTVLMSDIRGFTGIAERSDPSALAGQLNEHRAAMNRPLIDAGSTVMQFAGDSVMAVFGAPFPMADHADRALEAARGMHAAQAEVNESWDNQGLEPFDLGIGISTGPVAAALIGSEERLEYTVVGDIVNLTQRLQQWGEAGETVVSDPTWEALTEKPDSDVLEPALVKGRTTPVGAHRFPRRPA